MKMEWSFVEECVVLPDEFSSYGLRSWSWSVHDHSVWRISSPRYHGGEKLRILIPHPTARETLDHDLILHRIKLINHWQKKIP